MGGGFFEEAIVIFGMSGVIDFRFIVIALLKLQFNNVHVVIRCTFYLGIIFGVGGIGGRVYIWYGDFSFSHKF